MTIEANRNLNDAAQLVFLARHLVVFTGAGISTPSGIPDFRSHGSGLWEQDDPMEVASLSVFQRTPERFYNWYRPLVAAGYYASPNPAHASIAALEKLGLTKAVVTQNIDGLHQAAGSRHVLELHGSMRKFKCRECNHWLENPQDAVETLISGEIPRCPKCKSILKPGITLFEESLPENAWAEAQNEMKKADVLLIAGTSLEVMPASSLPLEASQYGCQLIIINFSQTYLDRQAAVCIQADVAHVFPVLLQKVEDLRRG